MKTIYRVLVLGILTMALTAVTATSLFAQDDPCTAVEAKQAVYKKFTDNYASKDIAQRKLAVEAGKEYVQKYGSCADDKDIVAYLNKTVPGIEAGIRKEEDADRKNALFTRFDTAIKAKNTADIFTVGKEILSQNPEFLDVMIVLATAGFDQASAKPPVDTYNNDAINYARTAIQKIESGAKSTTESYGVLSYSYKNPDIKEFSTTEGAKTNALGWMNYIIGYIDFYRLNKKEEGLAYLYKASQVASTTKSNPGIYQTIGNSYRDEVVKLGEKIAANLKAENGQPSDETKGLIAMQKGYADRAIDAFARAYKVADTSAAGKQYRDGLNESVKEIYTLRFEGKPGDVNAYTATLISNPLPDPASKVTPVAEEPAPGETPGTTPVTTPATTPTPAGAKPTATPSAAKPAATTKPATTNENKPPVKPVSSTTPVKPDTTKVTVTKSGSDESSTESMTKTPAKKPAPKKKGTR